MLINVFISANDNNGSIIYRARPPAISHPPDVAGFTLEFQFEFKLSVISTFGYTVRTFHSTHTNKNHSTTVLKL